MSIKVLHIITDVNIGGAGHHLLTLIDNINPRFHNEVIVPSDARLIPYLLKRHIPYHKVQTIATRSFSLTGVTELHAKIKQINPQIIHTHASLSGRIAGKLTHKTKIVNTVHSAFPLSNRRKQFPLKNITGLINNTCSDAIIAVSPACKDILIQSGTSPEKIHVVYNGMPPAKKLNSEDIQALKQKYGINENKFVAAIIARLSKEKGHDTILDAAKQLPEHIEILIAGDGPYETHLKQRIADENIRNVRMLGFVEKASDVMNIMDVQINASNLSEATSLALIEGMSLGKPAIVTNISGNPYVITDNVNGLLYEPDVPKALARNIETLASSKHLYANLAIGAREIYYARFTAKTMAKNIEAVYDTILAPGFKKEINPSRRS